VKYIKTLTWILKPAIIGQSFNKNWYITMPLSIVLVERKQFMSKESVRLGVQVGIISLFETVVSVNYMNVISSWKFSLDSFVSFIA